MLEHSSQLWASSSTNLILYFSSIIEFLLYRAAMTLSAEDESARKPVYIFA